MIDHEHSLDELCELMEDYFADEEDQNPTAREMFDEWVNDQGFGGELFVCEREWKEVDCSCTVRRSR